MRQRAFDQFSTAGTARAVLAAVRPGLIASAQRRFEHRGLVRLDLNSVPLRPDRDGKHAHAYGFRYA